MLHHHVIRPSQWSGGSGIVGKLRRRFCLFGDTVNMASRTETSCPSGCIQLTQACYELAAPNLSEFEVLIEKRGPVEVKGAAEPVTMYVASATELYL
jgi:class 3 adenylate cyclase